MARSHPKHSLLRLAVVALLVVAVPRGGGAAPLPMLGACPGGSPKVVIDVGHGGHDVGSISARGRGEFLFNRDLAHTIAAAVARAGGHPVLLNEEGADLSLSARVAMINAAAPAVLLSVHHDSVQPRYLEAWQVEGQPRDFSDRFAGYSLFISRKNASPAASERFGRLIGQALIDAGLTPSLHHAEAIPGEGRPLVDEHLGLYAYDGLAVLRGTKAPAVLLEAGIIKNRTEELAVQTPRFREQVAAAVVIAIGRFCTGGSETAQ